jgi:hypothetical protein
MRQKLRNRPRAETPVHGASTPINVGDTARQLALIETGNGWQHGVLEILVALLAAFMLVPLRPFLRSGSKDRR